MNWFRRRCLKHSSLSNRSALANAMLSNPTPFAPFPTPSVEEVLPYCSPQIRAMIELQRLTGMRSGEVVIMRTCDINQSDTVWTYTPTFHKTAYRGHSRVVFLGPQAQQLLKPWLRYPQGRNSCFHRRSRGGTIEGTARPTEGSAELREPSRLESEACTRKQPGERFDTGSYGKSIANALRRCNKDPEKAGGGADSLASAPITAQRGDPLTP